MARDGGAAASGGGASNAVFLAGGSLVAQVVNICYIFYAASVLGAEAFGAYSFLLAIQTMLSALARFGGGAVIAREVAVADAGRRHRILQAAWLQQVVIGGGLTVIWLVLVPWVPKFERDPWCAIAMASTIMLTGPVIVLDAFFVGVHRAHVCAFANVSQVVLKAAVGIALILSGWGIEALVTAFLAATVAWSGVYYVSYWRHSGKTLLPGRGESGRVLLRDGAQVAAGQVASSLFNRFDWIFLGTLKTDAVVGAYAVAYRAFEVLIRLLGMAALGVFPSLCRAESEERDIKRQLALLLKSVTTISTVVFIMSLVWGGECFASLLGEEYREAGSIFAVLASSLLFHAGCGVYYHLVIARRRQKHLAVTASLAALLNIGACLLLIPRFGAMGAAWAMLPASAVQLFMLAAIASEQRGVLAVLGVCVRVAAIAACAAVCVRAAAMPPLIAISVATALALAAAWFLGGISRDEKRVAAAQGAALWRRACAACERATGRRPDQESE